MPAVLVHGVPDTHRLWEPVRRELSRRDVVTPSLPGFGCPVPAGFDVTKESYVDWLIAEIESLGEPVDLVGHDWGSILVQRVAALRPDLTRTWAAGNGPVDEEYVWHDTAKMWQTPDVGEQVMAALTPDLLRAGIVAAGVPDDLAARAVGFLDETMKDCILRLYRSAVDVGAEWAPDMSNAKPGLALWSEDDPYVAPEFGRRLAERVGGRFVLLEGCGHWWPSQRPAETARVLEEHWATG